MQLKSISKYLTIIFLSIFSIQTIFALSKSEINIIKQKMIAESIKNYKGNCPCPYSKMKDGKLCGKFSAYSKKGAKKPLCYVTDITDKMVENYKK